MEKTGYHDLFGREIKDGDLLEYRSLYVKKTPEIVKVFFDKKENDWCVKGENFNIESVMEKRLQTYCYLGGRPTHRILRKEPSQTEKDYDLILDSIEKMSIVQNCAKEVLDWLELIKEQFEEKISKERPKH